MKPNGLAMTLDSTGMPRLTPTPIDRATDQIWEAVREAISANMTPERFKSEVVQAWAYVLKEDADYATKVLSK